MILFVYGTLKKGFENHYFLDGAKFLGCATTKHRYPMVNIVKAYPYLIDDKNNGKYINGEVYKIDREILERLDHLEGYPDYYTRKKILLLQEGIEIVALTYFINQKIDYAKLELLESFEKDSLYYDFL